MGLLTPHQSRTTWVLLASARSLHSRHLSVLISYTDKQSFSVSSAIMCIFDPLLIFLFFFTFKLTGESTKVLCIYRLSRLKHM